MQYSEIPGAEITDRIDEPYRRFLTCLLFRLKTYGTVIEFLEDLRLIRSSLCDGGGNRLAEAWIDPLI